VIYVILICSLLVVLATIALLAWYVVPLLIRSAQVKNIRDTCRREGLIVLTYDDGPSEKLTKRLLEELDELDTKVTFFVTGVSAGVRPDDVRALRERGHEVGCHSERHVNALKSLPWKAGRDCSRGMKTLEHLGIKPKFYRPPYGNATLGTILASRSQGSRVVWWTHDSGDTGGVPGKANSLVTAITSRLGGGRRRALEGDESGLLEQRLHPDARAEFLAELDQVGGVVLFHDSDRGHDALDEYTIQVTREIVERARESGKTITTMEHLMSLTS
jgi:peptidoglycan/xylan/chitin deacetylase (PgdA/CDA1 family)